MQNSFTDLRQNDGRLLDDSFWPSFTDVMTVIVMIFLIATTVLIIKNWELVHELEQRIFHETEISTALKETIVEKNKTHQQLLANIAAKKQISRELEASIVALQKTNEIAEQNQAENKTLEQQLDQAKSNLRLLKLQLLKVSDQLVQNQNIIIHKDHSINEKKKQISSLENQIQHSLKDISLKEKSLLDHSKEIIQLQNLLDQSRNRTSTLQQQIDNSNIEIKQAKQSLEQSKKQLQLKQQIITKNATIISSWEKKLNHLLSRFLKQQQQLKKKDQLYLQAKQTVLRKQKKLLDKDKQFKHLSETSKARLQALETGKKALLSINSKYKQLQIDLQKQKIISQNQHQTLQQLNKTNKLKHQQLAAMEVQILLAEQQKQKQNKKFSKLEEKYKKLIRPARSVIGKYVVEVRYEKIDGKEVVWYKDVGDERFSILDIQSVNKKLAKLKQQYAQRLYVKVIIPDNSGLSYKEAWNFMQDIFNKYDYYYQESEDNL